MVLAEACHPDPNYSTSEGGPIDFNGPRFQMSNIQTASCLNLLKFKLQFALKKN